MKILLTALCLIYCGSMSIAQQDTLSLEEQFNAKEEGIVHFYRKGKYKEAVKLAREVLVWTEEKVSKEDVLYARAIGNLGTTLNWAGENHKALIYMEKAKTLLKKEPKEAAYIELLNNLGMLYKDLGRYEKALPLLKDNITRYKSLHGENHYMVSVALNNLALLYQTMGQYEEAIVTIKKSIALTEQSVGKKHARYVTRVGALASFYQATGEAHKAVTILEEVLPVIVDYKGKEHGLYTSAAHNLAKAYDDLERYDEAVQLLEDVLLQAEKIYGTDHPTYGIYLVSLADIQFQNNQLEQALMTLDKSLDIDLSNAGKNSRNYFRTYKRRPVYLESMGRLGEVAEQYQTMVEIMNWISKQQFPYFNEKNQNTLMTDWRVANDFLHSFQHRHPHFSEMAGLGYNQNLLLKGLLKDNYKNLMNTIRNKHSVETLNLAAKWEILKIELSQQYNLPLKKRMPQLDSLERRVNDLESQLAQATQEFKTTQQDIDWKDIQATLKTDEVAIEFSHFNYYQGNQVTDRIFYVAYVLSKNAMQPLMIPLFEEKALGNLKATRRLYQHKKMGDKPLLKNLIWQPLAEVLKDKKTIYFSLSGLLHRVNLGAIPINEKETIADAYRLVQLGSTRQLTNQQLDKSQLKNAVLYGNIQYSVDSLNLPSHPSTETKKKLLASRAIQKDVRAYRGGDWEALDFTKKEVEDIQQTLEKQDVQVKLLTGTQATEESFKAIDDKGTSPDLLHLATHGYFFATPKKESTIGVQATENPLVRSGLILAGANRVWEGDDVTNGVEDGILTAYEIAQMDLSNTELVVLSACETGLGDIEGSEGVYGLQRAFKIAGAKYILMSLWKVRDEPTQEFMAAFYRAWLEEGKAIPLAFQVAQGILRKKYAEPFNPRLWAGFVLLK